MGLQYFVLDSTQGAYAAAIAALQTATSAKYGYAPTQIIRAAAHDSAIKIVAANVLEAELAGDTADLHIANFPNSLCRHRFADLAEFRIRGFHMLGESIRSAEGVAGRLWRYIRPPQSWNAAENYGNGDGTTYFDAFNGPQDLAIGSGANQHQTGTSYDVCGGVHVRFGNAGNGGNPGYPNGMGSQGLIGVADAAGLGAPGAIRVRGDYSFAPGMFWGSHTLWERHSPLPWEEYGAGSGIYVQGKFQNAGGGQSVGQAGWLIDADVDDIAVSAATLLLRHHFAGKTSLSDLDGAGGRCRYHAQAGYPGPESWNAVFTHDGTSFADVTAAANDAAAGDWTVLPASAPDGSAVYFVSSDPFSTITWSGAVGALGTYTGVWEYSQGSGAWAQFTNIEDNTNAWKAGANIHFNPKIDWALDTVNGTEGFAVRWRKTGGSVTTGAVGTQTQKRRDALFIHRWNDGPPVRGACHGSPTSGFASGLRYDLKGKGNYEFVNFRQAGQSGMPADTWATCLDLTLRGCQLAPFGDLQYGSSNMAVKLLASADGIRWWDQSDIRVLVPSHQIFQDILSKPGADQTKFLDSERWTDLVYCINGPYPGVAGGRWSPIAISGCRIRHVGERLDLLNDADVIDLWVNDSPTDHHSLAVRGSFDADACIFERLGFEDFLRAVEIYVPATGNNDAPVGGASSSGANYHFRYGYHADWNGMTDSGQPNGGFVFSGDNDRLHGYRDGSGDFSGNQVQFWYFRKIDDPAAGTAIANSSEIPVTVRDVTFAECNWQWSIGRSFGPEGCVAVVEDADAGPAYSDITDSVRPSSGGGVTAAMFPASPAVGDACHFRFRAQLNWRLNLTFDTAAAGAFTVVWEYRAAGGVWTQVTNLAGSAAGLTASGAVTFDRPDDAERFTIDTEDFFDVRCRLASGAFTTPPVLATVTSRYVGPAIDIDRYKVISPGTGIGRVITNRWSGGEANSAFVKDDHMDCTLAPGQSVTGDFYKIGSTSVDTPDLTFAEWQALTKSKTNTEASEDSVFGPSSTMQEAP